MNRLEHFAHVEMGQSPPGDTCNNAGEGVPLLNGPTEFGPHHPTPEQWTVSPKKYSRAGDILFCVRGSTTGRMNWSDKAYAIGRGLAALRHKHGLEYQPFLHAVISNSLHSLLAASTGSTFPNVSRNQLLEMFFPPFPLATQLVISRIVGSLNEKIELNRKMNLTLEDIARAIFKSWFIDFDPVVAKSEGRKPLGMSDELAALFPSEFEDSELGAIPKGWSLSHLGEIATNPKRQIHPKDVDPTTPYIGLEHMPRKSIVLDSWGLADEVTSTKSRFFEGEILFGKLRPYFHKVGVALTDGICSTDILTLAPSSPEFFGLLIAHVSSSEFISYTDSTSGGTRQPRVKWEDMEQWPIVIPPPETSTVLSDLYRNMVQQFQNHAHQTQLLESIRNTLLPKLLSGELDVRELESVLGGVC